MPMPGYKQSPEHKKKRLSQIEEDGNGRYKDGRRSYRKKAGAETNDGTIVHHKNGDRSNNSRKNLERLSDGKKTPGRRTTPRHEQMTDRFSRKDAIELAIRNDRGKKCGNSFIPSGKRCQTGLGQSIKSQRETARLLPKPTGGLPDREFKHTSAKESRHGAAEAIGWGVGGTALAAGTVLALSLYGRKRRNALNKEVATITHKPKKGTSNHIEQQPPKPKDEGVTAKVQVPAPVKPKTAESSPDPVSTPKPEARTEPTEAMKSSPRVQAAKYALARIPGRNYENPDYPLNNEEFESVPDEYRQRPAGLTKDPEKIEEPALLSRPFRQVTAKLPFEYEVTPEGKITKKERKLSDLEIYTENPTLFGGVNLSAVDRRAGKQTRYLPSQKQGIPPITIEGDVVSGGGRPKRTKAGQILGRVAKRTK